MPNPILMDWVVIAAYGLAAMLSYMASRCVVSYFYSSKSQVNCWCILVALLLLLGINKFLYFENCITQGFSLLAHNNGWYEARRDMQVEFILIGTLIVPSLLAAAMYMLNGPAKPLQSAVIAFVLLLLLVVVRTISLHQVDALIFPDILGIGIGINWIIELACNLWIGLSAWIYLQQYNQQLLD